jgi:cystathionine gamma-synthase
MGPTLIRLSVGIEDGRDLLADLAQAFAAVEQAMLADGATPAAAAVPTVVTSAPGTDASVQTSVAFSTADTATKAQQEFRLNPALAAFW